MKSKSEANFNHNFNEIFDVAKEIRKKKNLFHWFSVAPLNFGSKNERRENENHLYRNVISMNNENYDKFAVENSAVTNETKAILKTFAAKMQSNDTLKVLHKISTIFKVLLLEEQNFKTTEKEDFVMKLDISFILKSILSEVKEKANFSLEKEESLILERYLDCQVAMENLRSIDELKISNDKLAKQTPNKAGKGTKRKRAKEAEDTTESSSKHSRSTKKDNESGDKAKKSSKDKIPDVSALDFSNDSKSSSGASWNFKISSWNINGIRAWLEKNGLSYLHHELPDIMCVQETKCSDDKLPEEVKEIEGYHCYWLSGDKEGYSGVGLLSKEKPVKVEYGIGIAEHDNEGRVITAEYEQFYLVSTYVPNAGRGLVRLDYRMKWDQDFREYLKKLDAQKPVILCGDLNVAHEEIDLANPKTNKKNAGFTKEEREGFSSLLKEGFVDTFRHLYPDVKGAYTFWTYMMNARAKNVGWRLDYFVMSEKFTEKLCDNVIRKDVFGSDHCPITLFLAL